MHITPSKEQRQWKMFKVVFLGVILLSLFSLTTLPKSSNITHSTPINHQGK
jgi:hypothetical protein